MKPKTIFLPIIKKSQKIDFSIFKILPKNLVLLYTSQYKKIAELIYKKLKKTKKITAFQQILGCSKLKFKTKNILLISDGKFHALNLLLQNYNVYIYNNNKINQVSKGEIEKLKSKRKSALVNFYHAEEKAILVSIKPGQYNLKLALNLAKKYKAKIFLGDIINLSEFENFSPKIWINTACPTLIYDSTKIINPEEIY